MDALKSRLLSFATHKYSLQRRRRRTKGNVARRSASFQLWVAELKISKLWIINQKYKNPPHKTWKLVAAPERCCFVVVISSCLRRANALSLYHACLCFFFLKRINPFPALASEFTLKLEMNWSGLPARINANKFSTQSTHSPTDTIPTLLNESYCCCPYPLKSWMA